MNLRVIINPRAAGGRTLCLWPRLEPLLSRRHRPQATVSTNPADMRREIAKARCEGADGIILVGGDGTVHEALPSLCEADLPFGILPTGRGNDFARNLQIPLNLRRACALPASPSQTRVDVPYVNDTPFGSIACVGFDAAVNKLARDRQGYLGGAMGYAICVIKALHHFHPFEIEMWLDGVRWVGRVMLVAVANGPCYGGGMRIAPSASIHDGRLTVCIVRETSKIDLLAQFPRVYRGTHVNHPGVVVRDAREVHITAPAGGEMFADGEPCGILPVECRIGTRRLRVLMPDAGALAVRKGLAQPFGSLTQTARLSSGGGHADDRPPIREIVPLAGLSDIVFGGWDIRNETCYAAARAARVLEEKDLSGVKDELEALRPMKGVFEPKFVPRLPGVWVKSGLTKYDLMERLRDDIREFRRVHGVTRLVMIWCGSTEIRLPQHSLPRDLDAIINGMKRNDPGISPSMLYAFAALSEGVPHVNCTPNITTDCPALDELARIRRVPLAGKDLKTVLAPMLKARMLGISGWFSTNLLGNRDGEVLDEPECFRAKEQSKLSSLEKILEPGLYPQLYGDICHKVTIHYYPPRGDNKEGWDNIDIFGWLGYPMQLKINFLCRDSILAAPIVLDLALFMDLAARAGSIGIQDWLSFFFKCPLHKQNDPPEHNLFSQLTKLESEIRRLAAFGWSAKKSARAETAPAAALSARTGS